MVSLSFLYCVFISYLTNSKSSLQCYLVLLRLMEELFSLSSLITSNSLILPLKYSIYLMLLISSFSSFSSLILLYNFLKKVITLKINLVYSRLIDDYDSSSFSSSKSKILLNLSSSFLT